MNAVRVDFSFAYWPVFLFRLTFKAGSPGFSCIYKVKLLLSDAIAIYKRENMTLDLCLK